MNNIYVLCALVAHKYLSIHTNIVIIVVNKMIVQVLWKQPDMWELDGVVCLQCNFANRLGIFRIAGILF